MKIIKAFNFTLASIGLLVLAACDNDVIETTTESITSSVESTSSEESTTSETSSTSEEISTSEDATTTIYLAGDSTVKTYNDNQFIGGWGQYLGLFLDEKVNVVNCAEGGRSSRSFINEGRLYDISDSSYSYNFSTNGGNSIEDTIQSGDYLFIQFGHNDDDTKKTSSYSTLYNRMVPLGDADSSGIYPTTAGTKVSTSSLPSEYVNNSTTAEQTSALAEIAKYGTEYYSYDCGGTYKWYLKQYIDFARDKGATPVLVTPVARKSFNSDGTLKSGAGLHGENFAYVTAVRQLAEEEDCLLIDLFADTKEILETATSSSADYLMALKPNDLVGTWPTDYDSTYGNSAAGYTGIEGTHYNKYGAFITAAKACEDLKALNGKVVNSSEMIGFVNHINSNPSTYIDPSNLLSKTKVAEIEALFTTVNVTNPNRTYNDPSEVVALINELPAVNDITENNYLDVNEQLEAILAAYNKLNVDDKSSVTNYDTYLAVLEKVNEIIDSLKVEPTRFVQMDLTNFTMESVTSSVAIDDTFTVVGTSDKAVSLKTGAVSFSYSGTTYSVSKYFSMGGSATFGKSRYIEFSTTGACQVTVVAKSSGSSDRTISMVNSTATGTVIGSFAAGASQSITTLNVDAAGTYQIGSAGSGVYIYAIIIEYFD